MAGKAHPFESSPLIERSELFKAYLQALQTANSDQKVEPENHGPIEEDDVLLIVDAQNDFVPFDDLSNKSGGHAGVKESQWIMGPVVGLIRRAVSVGATVVAVKDYHPINHVSFQKQGGTFPPHCVQGSRGADFVEPVAQALATGRNKQGSDGVLIAFKGYHEDVDSLGAFAYQGGAEHLHMRAPGKDVQSSLSHPDAPWTGAAVLKQSEILLRGVDKKCTMGTLNAPPDLLAMFQDEPDRLRHRRLEDAMQGKKRLFVCGLPLELGVLDTCLAAKKLNFQAVYVVLDATRAAHGASNLSGVPPPDEVWAKLTGAGVQIAGAAGAANLRPDCLAETAPDWDFQWRMSTKPRRWRQLRASLPTVVQAEVFPSRLGAFLGLADVNVKGFCVTVDLSKGMYYAEPVGDLKLLKEFGFAAEGKCSPKVPLPKVWQDAPDEAQYIIWGAPLHGLELLYERTSTRRLLTMLKISTAPELCFALWGGFLLLDANDKVVKTQLLSAAAMSKTGSNISPSAGLWFADAEEVPTGARDEMVERFQEVIWPNLVKRKAHKFCWVGAGETFGREQWQAPSAGGLVFTVGPQGGARTIVFPLSARPPVQ